MTLLDRYVDELEHAIDSHGVLAVDPRTIAPTDSIEFPPHLSRTTVIVEMLRVWMEHRWSAGVPTTADDCLQLFSNTQFVQREIAELRSEETRQRSLRSKAQDSGQLRNRHSSSVPPFPTIGNNWCGFELLAILGTGAIAQVYLAKQPDLASRFVALKLTYRESFESHWLATLQHSAIVPVYSTHVEGELFGICMPYLGNTTLQDVRLHPRHRATTHSKRWWKTDRASNTVEDSPISSTIRMRCSSIDTVITSLNEKDREALSTETGEPKPPSDKSNLKHTVATNIEPHNRPSSHERMVLEMGIKLADALVHAHRAGIIHSDIKPANVLLSDEGDPRLIDFNVSYRNRSTESSDSEPLGGTLPYMSPELKKSLQNTGVSGLTVDHRTDIYSLGMVMIELLCGQLLDEREFRKWQNTNKWTGNISPALSAILLRCISVDISKRYDSTQQLSDDLRAQWEHRPLIHTPEPSVIERCLKWGTRHPRIASSATSLVASLVIILALTAGIVSANHALERAKWRNRIARLEAELPNALSLVTSLDVTPELEPDASRSVDQSIALVSSLDDTSSNKRPMDPRWVATSDEVPDELRSQWRLLVSLAKSRRWATPPSTLETVPSSEWDTAESIGDGPHDRVLKSVLDSNYRLAIESLMEQTRRNPRDYFAWWLLGDCYLAVQDWNQAEQAYTVCTSLRPEIAIVYFNRGLVRFATHRFHDAEKDYEQTLKLSPHWHTCRLNKALCYQAMGRFQDALDELAIALQNNYQTVSVLRLQSILYLQLGDPIASAQSAKKALELTPTTEAQWVDFGLLELPSAPQRAADAFHHALQLNPRSVDARQKLAYVYSECLHDTDSSLAQLDALVEMLPLNPTHRAGRAVVVARLGKREASLRDVGELEKIPNLEPLILYQMACVFSLLGQREVSHNGTQGDSNDLKEGMRWLRKATLLDSGFIEIANSDPDLEWLRGDTVYSEWIQVVRSYHQP